MQQEASDLFARSDLLRAKDLCLRILAQNPRRGPTLQLLGLIAYRREEGIAATSWFRKAAALEPRNAQYQSNLGGALLACGKLREARFRFRRAVALQPDFAEAHYNLANLLRVQGQLEASVQAYRSALDCNPSLYEAHTNLGNVLLALRQNDAAAACFYRALAIKPNCPQACSSLGNLRQAEGRMEEAAAHYEEALSFDRDFADAHSNLGTVLLQQGRLTEARECHRQAIALRPQFAEAHHNLGCVLQQMQLPEAASASFARAIELKPAYANAHLGLALLHLSNQDFRRGWEGYDWRWRSSEHATRWRDYPFPVWKGEPVKDGRVLIWGEQGIGDEVMFAGMVAEASATGVELVLDCDRRLHPLFARSFPQVQVVSGIGPEEAALLDIVAHLPGGSLPALFRATASTFQRSVWPYLVADPLGRAKFRERYKDGRKVVGLSWYTNNPKSGHRRTVDPHLLRPLCAESGARTGVQWISLQYGEHEALESTLANAGLPVHVDRTVNAVIDFDSFASQVAAMDLVITIDNSTAHLAGALGVPVWLLLPALADWRWFERRSDSPWYPSMRLFRQQTGGSWTTVLAEVAECLDKLHNYRASPGCEPDETVKEADRHCCLL